MLQLEALFGTVGARADEQVLAGHGTNMDVELTGYEILADIEHEITEGVKMQNTAFQLDQLFCMYNHVKRFGVDRTFLSLYNNDGRLNAAVGVRFPSCEDMNAVGSPNSNASRAFIAAMEDENGGFFSKVIAFAKKVWDAIVKFVKTVWTKIKSWFGNIDKQDEKANAEIQRATVPADAKAEVEIPKPSAVKRAFTNIISSMKKRAAFEMESNKLCYQVIDMVNAGASAEKINRYIENADKQFQQDMRDTYNYNLAIKDTNEAKARAEAENAANKEAANSTAAKKKWLKLFGITSQDMIRELSGNGFKEAAKDVILEGKDMNAINAEITNMLTALADGSELMQNLEKFAPADAANIKQALSRIKTKNAATDINQIRNRNGDAKHFINDVDAISGQYAYDAENNQVGTWDKIKGMFNTRTKLAAYHQKEAQEIVRDLSAYRVHLHQELLKIYKEVVAKDRDLKLQMNQGNIRGQGSTGRTDREIENEYKSREQVYGRNINI